VNKIYWIEKGRLAGRCGPSVVPLDLNGLQRAGFSAVLSLDAEEFKLIRPGPDSPEVKLIHLTNSIPPKPIEKEIFAVRLPQAVDHAVEIVSRNEGPVLVHCHAGNDRTGGVLTGYLCLTANMTPRRALARVREANPDAISAEGYEEMILAILERWIESRNRKSSE